MSKRCEGRNLYAKSRIHSAQPVLDWVVAQTQDEPVNDATLLRLHAWKEGKAVPTLRQIEEVSKKTKIPFGYFFLKSRLEKTFR